MINKAREFGETAISVAKEEGKAHGIKLGEARGMEKVFALLEKGVSLKEAKKRLRGRS